jgi:hypothetical protein
MQSKLKSTIFGVVTLCSSERNRHFGGIDRLHLQARSSCRLLLHDFTIRPWICKCIWSYETPCPLRTTPCYNPEHYTLHSHCLENLDSNQHYITCDTQTRISPLQLPIFFSILQTSDSITVWGIHLYMFYPNTDNCILYYTSLSS